MCLDKRSVFSFSLCVQKIFRNLPSSKYTDPFYITRFQTVLTDSKSGIDHSVSEYEELQCIFNYMDGKSKDFTSRLMIEKCNDIRNNETDHISLLESR